MNLLRAVFLSNNLFFLNFFPTMVSFVTTYDENQNFWKIVMWHILDYLLFSDMSSVYSCTKMSHPYVTDI